MGDACDDGFFANDETATARGVFVCRNCNGRDPCPDDDMGDSDDGDDSGDGDDSALPQASSNCS